MSPALTLLTVNPQARFDMLILSLSNIFGLFFIFLGLSKLGPIQLAFVTSSRKVVSVLTSILAFGKAITIPQGVGIVLVLAGMLKETFSSSGKKDSPPSAPTQTGKEADPTKKDK